MISSTRIVAVVAAISVFWDVVYSRRGLMSGAGAQAITQTAGVISITDACWEMFNTADYGICG